MSDATIDQTSERSSPQEKNGVGGNGHGSAPLLDDLASTSSDIPGNLPDTNDHLIQESLQFMPGGHPSGGLHMPYSAFPAGDGSSWTAVMDPTMMASFGFPGSSVLPGQYIVGSEMIWSQDPLLMGYQFLNPVAVEQATNVHLDQSIPSSTDSVSQITPTFGSIALNGSVQGSASGAPASVIPSAPDVSAGIENTISVSTTSAQSSAPQPEKPKSWAAIASQPAKPRPPPPPKPQPKTESSTVESGKKLSNPSLRQVSSQPHRCMNSSSADTNNSKINTSKKGLPSASQATSKSKVQQSDIVGKLHSQNKYNPPEMSINLTNARYFVIKSYAEDDIHRSIKYSMWTSTEHGNRRLDQAFKEQKGKPIYLFYSVNGSGHFCGMAQMKSEVDFHNITGVWAQDKWKGRFDVKWLYVKDVPNSQLRHIRLENNENKPVTNSRDTQEIPSEKGRQVVKIVHSYVHTTSIFDDFEHYEKKQQEDSQKKK